MIELINQLVSENFPGIVIRFKSGTAWLVLHHYKYVDMNQARTARLGKILVKKDGYAYITEPIKSINQIQINPWPCY